MSIVPRFTTILLLFLLPLIGCRGSAELIAGLDEKQAIEVLVTLQQYGLQAERVKTSSGRKTEYQIEVRSGDLARGLEVLKQHGFPRSERESVEEFTRPSGMTPLSPVLSDLRLDHALELRLERILSAMPGVIEARAIVHSHLRRHFAATEEKQQGPSASVVLRFVASEAAPTLDIAKIRQIIAQSLPGLNSAEVVVEVFQVSGILPESSQYGGGRLVKVVPFSFRVASEDREIAGVQLLVMLVLWCFAGVLIGALWSARSRRVNMRRGRRGTAAGETAAGTEGEGGIVFDERTRHGGMPALKDLR